MRLSAWPRRSLRAALVTSVAVLAPIALVAASAATPALRAGAVRALPGHLDPSALACAPGAAVLASTCLDLATTSSTTALVTVVDGVPKASPPTVPGGVGVACMSATTCLVVGTSPSSKGTLEWISHGRVAKSVTLRNSSYLNGVACTTSSCIVVGELYGKATNTGTPTYGVAARVTEAESSPVATKVGGVAALDDAACATPSSCVAVGTTETTSSSGDGAVVPITSGHVGGRRLAKGTDGLDHVSCGTATTCWASGTSYSAHGGVTSSLVLIAHGVPGGRRVGPPIGGAIACVDATICLYASGTSQYGKGEVLELSSGKVVRRLELPRFAYGSLSGIACPTATSCAATGATGFHNPGPSYFYTGAVVSLRLT